LSVSKIYNAGNAAISSQAKHPILLNPNCHSRRFSTTYTSWKNTSVEDLGVLQSGREKIAADLTADPNNALRLLTRVATLSAEAPQPGQGVPKSASAFNTRPDATDEFVEDGWDLVLKHGA